MVEWKRITKFPAYDVSDDGHVRRRSNMRVLMGAFDRNEHMRVGLIFGDDARVHNRYVHDLVAEAFLEPKPGPEWGIGHNDGDLSNCRVENLSWTKEGHRRARPKNRRIEIIETGERFKNASECARYLGVSFGTISKHMLGNTSHVKGIHLRYI